MFGLIKFVVYLFSLQIYVILSSYTTREIPVDGESDTN